MYRENMYIKLLLAIFIELLIIYFCFISKEKIITTFIFCITLLSLIVSHSYAINLWEFYYNHKDYIDEIIKYKKGYTFKVRIPKDIKEDIIFRSFASKNMIKELDNYLENNKKDKILKDEFCVDRDKFIEMKGCL